MTDKVFDYEFVSRLGRNIETAASDALPDAKNRASEGIDTMMGAGQAGGILVAVGFFLASEYLENTWETKQEQAAEMNQVAQRFVRNWQETERAHSR